MNVKVFKKYKVQNKFRIWSSILTILMIASRWVGGQVVSGRWVGGSVGLWSVGLWSVGWWSVVLIKPVHKRLTKFLNKKLYFMKTGWIQK